jgi:iron complex transport system permease protein
VASICAGLAFGSVPIPAGEIVRILLVAAGLAPGDGPWPQQHDVILLELRLPRVAGAAAVGAALSVSGALLQGLLRNPLADPYAVGASGGAALGAVVGMLFGGTISWLGFGVVPPLAFAGALVAVAVVVRLGSLGGRLPVVSILLAGFAVSTILGYTVSLFLVLGERWSLQLPRVYAWLLGGIHVTGWQELRVVLPVILAGLVLAMFQWRSLNAFAIGEEGASHLGIAVERDKRRLLAAASLLTATAVSISGLIGFIGLVVPHSVRMTAGPDHRRVLPASALAGAATLTLADLFARVVVAPAELPVGILTALGGGPFFLFLLYRTRNEYRW